MSIPTSEITQLRTDLEAIALPDTVNILTGTLTADGAGGQTMTWGTTGTSIACRMDFTGGIEVLAAGALSPYSTWKLTLPNSATITTSNRVEHSGHTYNVITVDEDKSWAACKRCELTRVS